MILETDNLTKWYGSQLGCQDICLSVPEGQVFGFLGPNGAGKSTVIKLLVGLIFPTYGSARILGKPPGDTAARRRMGFLPENFRYPEWLTGRELLDYYSAFYQVEPRRRRQRFAELLELVGLSGREKDRIKSYSKGMQQRLGLACALLANPDIIFLDEPSSALDPLGRREVREIIRELRRQGKTVFLNSHLLGEVEAICDRVAIIKKGRVVAQGSFAELAPGSMELEIEVKELLPSRLARLEAMGYPCRLTPNGPGRPDTLTVSLKDCGDVPEIARMLVEQGVRLYSLNLKQPPLEEIYVHYMENDC